MSYDELLKEYNALPLNYKKEVEDFIGYLAQKTKKKVTKEKPVKRKLGFAKGKAWMAPDFDGPLDGVKELAGILKDVKVKDAKKEYREHQIKKHSL